MIYLCYVCGSYGRPECAGFGVEIEDDQYLETIRHVCQYCGASIDTDTEIRPIPEFYEGDGDGF